MRINRHYALTRPAVSASHGHIKFFYHHIRLGSGPPSLSSPCDGHARVCPNQL